MKKIVLIILEESYARNFLNKQVLGELGRKHELILIIDSRIKLGDKSYDYFSKIIKYDASEIRSIPFYSLFNEVLRWRFRARSNSFVYRESGIYPSIRKVIAAKRFNRNQVSLSTPENKTAHKEYRSGNRPIVMSFSLKILERLRWMYLIFIRKYLIRLLSQNPFFYILGLVGRIHDVHARDLEILLLQNQVELILFPTGGMRPADIDLINLGIQNSITTFFVIENWDNLSSKTIFWKKPDFIGTWGPQSSIHAIDIQEFDIKQIFELGSSRFCQYHSIQINPFTKELPKNYVVFVGSIYPYDEFLALKNLDEEISENPSVYGDLCIVYRPYPGSVRESLFYEGFFKRVVLDPQIGLANSDSENRNSMGLTPLTPFAEHSNLTYLPCLIDRANFLVGGLSSMLIEATLFNKNYLAFAYEEVGCISSPSAMLKGYTHFKEINKLHNLIFCDDFQMLKSLFRQCFLGEFTVESDALQKELDYFVNTDVENFGQRLLNAVNKID